MKSLSILLLDGVKSIKKKQKKLKLDDAKSIKKLKKLILNGAKSIY